MPRTSAAKTKTQVSSETSGTHAPLSISDRLIRTVVDAFAKVLSGLEMRNMLPGERHRFAGLRIATLPRRAKMQREAAETANFDPFARCQRIAHDFQQLLHCELHVLRR